MGAKLIDGYGPLLRYNYTRRNDCGNGAGIIQLMSLSNIYPQLSSALVRARVPARTGDGLKNKTQLSYAFATVAIT